MAPNFLTGDVDPRTLRLDERAHERIELLSLHRDRILEVRLGAKIARRREVEALSEKYAHNDEMEISSADISQTLLDYDHLLMLIEDAEEQLTVVQRAWSAYLEFEDDIVGRLEAFLEDSPRIEPSLAPEARERRNRLIVQLLDEPGSSVRIKRQLEEIEIGLLAGNRTAVTRSAELETLWRGAEIALDTARSAFERTVVELKDPFDRITSAAARLGITLATPIDVEPSSTSTAGAE